MTLLGKQPVKVVVGVGFNEVGLSESCDGLFSHIALLPSRTKLLLLCSSACLIEASQYTFVDRLSPAIFEPVCPEFLFSIEKPPPRQRGT